MEWRNLELHSLKDSEIKITEVNTEKKKFTSIVRKVPKLAYFFYFLSIMFTLCCYLIKKLELDLMVLSVY